jgi:magnesium-transporting ATPase (P-type)
VRSIALTPARVLLVIVVVAAAAVTLFSLFVARSLPMTISGLAVSGVAVFVLGLMAAAGSVRAAQNGANARAVAAAIFGGLCMLAAAGSLSVAIILGLLAAST